MKSSARVVVIGGGVIGCSILYHLTELGWSDVMLLERSELTAGSTWHAAAGIHGLHDNNNITRWQYYTMGLYRELERATGQNCGVHQPGSLYLASTRERVHQLRIQSAKARYFGFRFEELDLAEAARMHPLLDLREVLAVMYEPDAGYVDPAGVTQAYAAAARTRGAEIHRFTPVLETNPRADGSWDVVTERATVHAEHVVNAAGLWAREVAGLAGVALPLVPMEHQYFVTETIPEIAALESELPSVADRDQEYYLRQEGRGLLVGAYERAPRFWAAERTPQDFGQELLPDDLERIEEYVMRACARVPVLAGAGVKRVINGPMIWSPDASALLGPVPELRNYFCCCGIIPGFSQSGGLGMTLAQWIVEGEPQWDMFAWDLARFGPWATAAFTRARARDNYASRFRIHFPNEERAAGRPLRMRGGHARQRALGAVFGFAYGWEQPLWYARPGEEARDCFSFERAPWFDTVVEECRHLRRAVGVLDNSAFAKYLVQGPGAGAWLDHLLANTLPGRDGRMKLAPMLGRRGGVIGDFTVARLAADRYLVIGSGAAERYHWRVFGAHLPAPGVRFESLSERYAGFGVAGPLARDLLARLCADDLASTAFPLFAVCETTVAGVPSMLLRASFTGDLGYEVYFPQEHHLAVLEALLEAGADLGVRPVGARALGLLRIEKGYGSWGREYSPEYWPHECGLERLVKTRKGPFLNREAFLEVRERAPRRRLVCLQLEECGVDPAGGEPVFRDGVAVGYVSSGGYSPSAGTPAALAFLRAEQVHPGGGYEVAVLGQPRAAAVLEAPLFDPEGLRLRA